MTSLPAEGKKKLGLVIDLDICVGCHACAVSCKEWNSGGHSAPMTDLNPYGADPHGVWFNRVHTYEIPPDGSGAPPDGAPPGGVSPEGVSPEGVSPEGAPPDGAPPEGVLPDAAQPAGGATVHFPRSCLHCETPDCVTVCPTGASYKRAEDGIVLVNPDTCIGCKLCSWACPYGAREYDQTDGVMKKCTLCIDRIYNENLEEVDRLPACVATCPAGARHFGDLGDPESGVSRLVADRGGYDLLPEIGYRPVNKYLPPRPRQATLAATDSAPGAAETPTGFLAWVDRLLSTGPSG